MNLDTLHRAIETRLASRLPEISITSYPDLSGYVTLPLLVLELAEFDLGDDPGTGELALIAQFDARLVLDPTQHDAELNMRQLAARIAAEIHFQTWGLPVAPARIRDIGPDGFSAELDSYLVWRVSWTQALHVGEAQDLTLPTINPTEVLIGINLDDDSPGELLNPQESTR